jgi:hypothetical protein
MAQSHARRQRSVSRLPRYSIATARKIRPTSTSTSGTYRAENSEAYQNGKAAKIAAPAVISQTSLPSQTGPMVLSMTRLLGSSLAVISMCMPTPRSKPSRSRKPIQRIAMAMNQTLGRMSMSFLLVVGRRQYAKASTSRGVPSWSSG